jgi:hypothetical protein
VSGLASTVLALAVALAAFVWLYRRERTHGGVVSVYFVLGLVVVEAAVYPSPDTIPVGLFHPGGGSLSFRLVDVLVPLALLARLLARGFPQRVETAALCWLAFLFWLGVATVEGLLSGNPAGLVAFEAKAIVYLAVFILAAGVPLAEYVDGRRFERFVYATSALAAVLVFTDQANVRIDSDIAILPLRELGAVGADAATLFGTIGVVAATVGACRVERRMPLLLASTPLLVSVAAATQRAALLGAAVAVGVLLVLFLLAPRHVHTTPTELALAACAATGVLLLPYVAGAALGRQAPSVPLARSVATAISSEEKHLSSEARVAQLRAVKGLIAERPIFGWGLGKTYSYYDPGPREFVDTKLTHNIAADLLLRAGVVGLVLFVVALTVAFSGGIRTWFADGVDPPVLGFAVGAVATLAGLLAKGMVESLFEKYRLAVLMGMLAGVLLSAATARVRVHREAPVAARYVLH